jgi:hypothetical protein
MKKTIKKRIKKSSEPDDNNIWLNIPLFRPRRGTKRYRQWMAEGRRIDAIESTPEWQAEIADLLKARDDVMQAEIAKEKQEEIWYAEDLIAYETGNY